MIRTRKKFVLVSVLLFLFFAIAQPVVTPDQRSGQYPELRVILDEAHPGQSQQNVSVVKHPANVTLRLTGGASTVGSKGPSDNQVIVKYRDPRTRIAIQAHPDIVSSKDLLLPSVVVLNVTRGKAHAVIASLTGNPLVEYVEANYARSISFVPNDPYYQYQWHFFAIQMQQAWDISSGSGVAVAVIDTGVAYENYLGFERAPDLSQTVFLSGWDFVNNDAHPNDDNGHGTHVCGTIAQTTNNNIGVAGVAFNARIIPVKVLDQQGNGWDTDVANGIVWAVNNGAKIINLSLGGPDYSRTVEDAVNYAYANGVTVVAASGGANSGSVDYPAAYVNAIAVGAVRFDQTRAYYSNYGTALDFVAPGGDVNVDQNGDGYGDGVLQQTFAGGDPTNFGYYFWQGTSVATPHVSGLAALLYAAGYTTPDQIRQRMINGAKDLGSAGWDQYYGYGLIQCYDSLPKTTVTKTLTSTVSSTSYTTRSTTTTVTSYTSTSTLTSMIPIVTTVVLVPLTSTLTAQSTQLLTSIATATVTSYTSTFTSTSTIRTVTTVTVGPSTTTSTIQSTQVLTSTGTTTVSGYTTVTVTSYTGTQTSTSTIVVPTTVTTAPPTTTSTVETTQVLTSTGTTTLTFYTTIATTSYTSTETQTSQTVVYTTVTSYGPSARLLTATSTNPSTFLSTTTSTSPPSSTTSFPQTTSASITSSTTSLASTTTTMSPTTTSTVPAGETASSAANSTSTLTVVSTLTSGVSSESLAALLSTLGTLGLAFRTRDVAGRAHDIRNVGSLMRRRCLRR